MSVRARATISVTGKLPGSINNTKIIENGSYFKFTDSATAGAGNLVDGSKYFNGLGSPQIVNIEGGADNDPPEIRYYFDRNSVSATGLLYEAVLNIWPISETDDLIPVTAKMSFINDSTTNTSQEIANRFFGALRQPGTAWQTDTTLVNDFWFDEDGNSVNGNTYVNFVNEGGTGISAPYSYGSGYAFRVKGLNWLYGVSGSINLYGKVSLKKFENQPAYGVKNFDVITKDFDFDFPGVKKNIYKVIVSYKAPVDTSVGGTDSSGIMPRFAINGKMRLAPGHMSTDWKKFTIDTLPSTTTTEEGWDARYLRQELVAKNISDWKNVYSLAVRFLSYQGQSAKGFEIDDISIIYRLKSPK